jgi:50S ribosomal protein L16 3-hydroxylase
MRAMTTPIDQPSALLGGLSPKQFMRRHWQRKPLLVRQALPCAAPLLPRSELFALAARDDVESRLIVRRQQHWSLRRGPLPLRALPALRTPGWTLLVQGLDLHLQAAHELLSRFRFGPDARLDDLMLSYASDGGGVGPHIDAYDVFLLQISGRRRWSFGRCARPQWRDDVPLKMLAQMPPAAQSHVLDAGDILYLPPGWAHDGVAVGGDCMTASIGFRAPMREELAHALLARLDESGGDAPSPRYRDNPRAPTLHPAALPPALIGFARVALAHALAQPGAVERALGEWVTEPKLQVWFDADRKAALRPGRGIALDRRTRMAYVEREVFVNGESLAIGGRDAVLVKRLADARRLSADEVRRFSAAARAQIGQWLAAGWLHVQTDDDVPTDA